MRWVAWSAKSEWLVRANHLDCNCKTLEEIAECWRKVGRWLRSWERCSSRWRQQTDGGAATIQTSQLCPGHQHPAPAFSPLCAIQPFHPVLVTTIPCLPWKPPRSVINEMPPAGLSKYWICVELPSCQNTCFPRSVVLFPRKCTLQFEPSFVFKEFSSRLWTFVKLNFLERNKLETININPNFRFSQTFLSITLISSSLWWIHFWVLWNFHI